MGPVCWQDASANAARTSNSFFMIPPLGILARIFDDFAVVGQGPWRYQRDFAAQLGELPDRRHHRLGKAGGRRFYLAFQRHAVVASLAFDDEAGLENLRVAP